MAMTLEDLTKPGIETELDNLKTDNNFLKVEILKLREQQQDSRNQLTMVEERVRCAECKQQQMFSFLTKMSRNPTFVRQFVQKRMLRKELNGNEFGKKRRLPAMQDRESIELDGAWDINCENNVQVQDELLNMQSELTEMFPEVMEPGPVETPFQSSIDNKPSGSIQTQKVMFPDTAAVCMPVPPSKILGDNMTVDEELTANDSKFYLELENLIQKPHDCAGYVQKQVFHGCVGSLP
ncbi:heat shock factor protein HSF30-like [Momordica charantia]|uniref:Heat shock factor protein HSF30-like n=1 Tax=Momordica charantia TaxID=3673 RepID=A0A6J1DMQ3_MOMCH|nr:heat shock factor protein HSF30-like [Momordica charantia]